jgi:hypothetical protein
MLCDVRFGSKTTNVITTMRFNMLLILLATGLILTRNRTTLLVECSHCTFGNGKPKRTLGGEAHIAASSSTHGRKIRKVGV